MAEFWSCGDARLFRLTPLAAAAFNPMRAPHFCWAHSGRSTVELRGTVAQQKIGVPKLRSGRKGIITGIRIGRVCRCGSEHGGTEYGVETIYMRIMRRHVWGTRALLILLLSPIARYSTKNVSALFALQPPETWSTLASVYLTLHTSSHMILFRFTKTDSLTSHFDSHPRPPNHVLW